MKKLVMVLVALGLAISAAAGSLCRRAEDQGRLREGQDEVGRHRQELLEDVVAD